MPMKPRRLFLSGLLLLLAAILIQEGRIPQAQAQEASPTPTYDPLVEPPLPEHPTELELGRNLYWHWCMPCHGDVGQGLTGEWISVWEPDHQNCWARGCHAGNEGDLGFPVPTVVPAIVRPDRLAAFASVQSLSDYLRATHPPQRPGCLEDAEYQAIALYVFSQNERSLLDPTLLSTSAATPVLPDAPTPVEDAPLEGVAPLWWIVPLGGLILVVAALFLARRFKR
jgi:hypothetical protein